MPVNSTHAQYGAAKPQWARCRDAIAGQDAVYAQGAIYLPKLSGGTQAHYDAYRGRALFYNATGRTLDGMTGLIFRKEIEVEIPAGLQVYADDIDLSGTSLLSFAETVVDNLIAVGRIGVLVDYSSVEVNPVTTAEAESVGLRSYACIYPTESIISWRVGKYSQLLEVRLKECKQVPGKDEWETAEVEQYRVLDLFENKYRVRIFEIIKNKDVLISTTFPLMNNKNLDYIPFLVCNTNGLGMDVQKPPLLDLVDVNLSHYRMTADYRHGLHFTGLPTAVVTGHTMGENETLAIGSSNAWVFSEENAKAAYLEFQGAGLSQIKDALDGDEQKMASLGARMLAADKKATETAETASIHRSGENSVLASIANSGSQLLTKVMTWLAEWAGVAGTIKITLNTDYLPVGMSAEEITSLIQAWQSGAISKQCLFDNLKRGEVVAEDTDFDEEEEKINALPPLGAMQGAF